MGYNDTAKISTGDVGYDWHVRPSMCASMMGCSVSVLWKLVGAGVLPAPKKIGDSYRYWKRSELDEVVAKWWGKRKRRGRMGMVNTQLEKRVETLERKMPTKPVKVAFFSSRDEVHPQLGKTIEELESDTNVEWQCWVWDNSAGKAI